MKFKTELHCHSRDGSGCSSESAEEIVQKYLDRGYSTLCLTNHFLPIWSDDREEWLKEVNEKHRAYDILKEAAEGTALNVIYGLKVFDTVYALTNGGPGFATEVLYTGVYKEFSLGRYAVGTTLSSVMFIFMAVTGWFMIRRMTGGSEVEA